MEKTIQELKQEIQTLETRLKETESEITRRELSVKIKDNRKLIAQIEDAGKEGLFI
jgi:cell division protein FtsL